jgi:choline dehydrogenase
MAGKVWVAVAVLLRALYPAAAQPQGAIPSTETETFEYVVVGSGPGGSPLAANLARAGHKTLLLEAGDDEEGNLNEAVPAFGGIATGDPTMAWNFFVKVRAPVLSLRNFLKTC